MAGARQNNSQEFITNLSKKIEKMMDNAEEYNEDIIKLLGSIDKNQKNSMSVELKKQTLTLDKIHTSINKWNEKLTNTIKNSLEKSNQYGVQLNFNKTNLVKNNEELVKQTKILRQLQRSTNALNKRLSEFFKVGKNSKDSNSIVSLEKINKKQIQPTLISILKVIRSFRDLYQEQIEKGEKTKKTGAAAKEKSVENITNISKDNSKLVDLTEKSNKKLDDISDNLANLNKTTSLLLLSIDKKIGKQAGMTDYNKSALPDPKGLENFFNILVKSGVKALTAIMFSLQIVGKYTPDAINGAQVLSDSIKILAKSAEGVSIETAAKSVLAIGIIGRSKIENLLLALGKVSAAEFLFGTNTFIQKAENLAEAVKILASVSENLSTSTVAKSIAIYGLIEASKLKNLMKALNSTFGESIADIFTGNSMLNKARDLNEAIKVIADTSKGVRVEEVIKSILIYKYIAASNLDKLVNVLSKSFGFFGNMFMGGRMKKRATSLRVAVAILSGATTRVFDKEHGIDSSNFTLDNVAKSVLIYNLIGHGVGVLLNSLMKSFGFFGNMFAGSRIEKRATSLKKAIGILISAVSEIETEPLVKSIGSILILGIAVNLFVKPLIWAGLLFPLVWLGLKVISGGFGKLLSIVNEVQGNDKKILASSVLMATIAIFIGGLIFNSIIAAVLSPVILLGAGVMHLTVKLYISAINQIKQNNIKETDINKATALSAIIGTLTAILLKLVVFNEKINIASTLTNVGMFILTMTLLTWYSVKILNYITKNTKSLKPLEALTVSITNMVNAVTMILLSKFLEDPKTSFEGIIIFGLAMLAISYSTAYMIKQLQGANVTMSKIIGLVSMVLTLVGMTLLVIFAAKAVIPTDLIGVGLILLTGFAIIKGVNLMVKLLPKNHQTVLKGILSVLGFVAGMAAVILAVKFISPFIDLAATIMMIGVMYAFAYVTKKIGTKSFHDNALRAAKGLVYISAAIVVLGYAMLAFKSTAVDLVDVLVIGASVIGLGYAFNFLGKKEKMITKAAFAMAYVAGSIILLAVAYTFYKNSGIGILEIATLGISVLALGLSFYLLGKFDDNIRKGAIAVAISSLAIYAITFAMTFWKTAKATVADSLALGISLISIAAAMALAGSFWKQVAKGSLVLGLAAIAIIALTPALSFYKLVGFTVLDALSLSLTLIGIGGALGIVGSFYVSVLKGSLAIAVAAIAIGVLSIAVMLYKATGFTLLDGLSLSLTILMLGLSVGLIGLFLKPIAKGALALLAIAIGVGFLSVALFFFKQSGATGNDVLLLSLTVLAMGIVFGIVGFGWKYVLKGAAAIAGLGAAIWVVSKGMKSWKEAKVGFSDIATIAGTIAAFGIEFGIVGAFYKQILKGAAAIAGLGAALWVVSQGMQAWTKAKAKWSDVGILGATIAMLGVEFGIAGLGPVPLAILAGAAAIAGLGAALWVVSQGMQAWTKAKANFKDVKVLGATIGMLGVEFGLLGLGTLLIISGAAAMTAVSVPLIVITKALKTFASAKFEKRDGDILSHTLMSIVEGFLGGKIPGGIVAGLAFAAKSAARIALMVPAIPVMIGAAKALGPISVALRNFKRAGLTESDGVLIRNLLTSVVKSFGIIGDKAEQKRMGIKFDPDSVSHTVNMLSNIGNLLSSLAEGVKAWASLEINEYQVINPGTIKARLVLKGRRKLTQTDFDNAAYGMSRVIAAIGEPLAKLGRLQKGMSTGDPYLDSIYSGEFVTAGVKSLTGIGGILSSLAQGIKDFSQMSFTEYEVVNPGTDKAKLVPKSKRKLTDTEIEGAGRNIGKILSIVGYQFAKIGRREASTEGDWPWSGGWVTKGIDALDGISEILGSVTKGVISMVYNEIPTFELINGGTSKAKLVPGKSIKVTDADLEKASWNIGKILSIIAYEFAKIGRTEASTEGAFSGGWVTKGVKSLSGISGILKAVTENLVNIAYGSFQPMELINEGKPNAKLVLGKPIKFKSEDLIKSGETIGKILNTLGKSIVHFGVYARDNKGYFDASISAVSKVGIPVKAATVFMGDWNKLKDPVNMAKGIKEFFHHITSIFNPNKTKSKFISNVEKTVVSYTTIMYKLGKTTSAIDAFTNSISRFDKLKNPKESAFELHNFISTITANFDPSKNRRLKESLISMFIFVEGVNKIGKSADPLAKAAKNMDKIQKSVKMMKESINSMDLRKLTLTDSMLNSMAHLSKNPEAMARSIEKSINASFKALIEELKNHKASSSGSTNTVYVPSGGDSGSGDKGTGGSGGNIDQMTKGDIFTPGSDKLSKDIFDMDKMPETMTPKNVYMAMVEALHDVVIRTRAV